MHVYLVFINDQLLRVFREGHGQKAVDLLNEQKGRHGGNWRKSSAFNDDKFVQRWSNDAGVARLSVEKEEAE